MMLEALHFVASGIIDAWMLGIPVVRGWFERIRMFISAWMVAKSTGREGSIYG